MSDYEKGLIAKAERMIALVEGQVPLAETTLEELIWRFRWIISQID